MQYLGLFIIFACLNACTLVSAPIPQSSSTEGVVATPTPPNDNEPAPDLQIISSEKVQCREDVYDLQKVNNIGRQASDVRLVKTGGSSAVHSIQMPGQDEYSGFSLNWARASKRGFELSIEWGTRIHHEMTFDFACQKGRFILAGIKHDTFDKLFPEDGKKYQTKRPAVTPNVPFEKFAVTDFMVD